MRRVVILTYPGATLLDVVGPSEVFWVATRSGADYDVVVASLDGGPAPAGSGLVLDTMALSSVDGPVDTLMVVGGLPARRPAQDRRLPAAVRALAPRCRRVTSVCTGAFLLAEAGLLDGRRATTHWAWCDSLARRYPAIEIEPDRIFVRDGDVWTSAGITAGMDLALALVEDDHGASLARDVARWMVLFVQRPGGQAQFSSHLDLPAPGRADVRRVLDAIAAEPGADHSVAALAGRAGMSPRHLARLFRAETGTTVAHHVERVRVETARHLLESSDAGLDAIARRCGFGTVETFHRSFKRCTGITPGEHRARFA
ncbi:MAG TPA: GlxA family transcriptional regulator [Acidimicrobiales bacterium]|nr:GlxA family transcriptional regulator [Acidimicrobiales bacterium]